MNVQKYKVPYFMPPEMCYDWVRRTEIEKAPPVGAAWICGTATRR